MLEDRFHDARLLGGREGRYRVEGGLLVSYAKALKSVGWGLVSRRLATFGALCAFRLYPWARLGLRVFFVSADSL